MKWLKGYRIKLMLVVFMANIVLRGGGNAKADFRFGTPMLFDEPVNSIGIEHFNYISDDGLEIYIESPVPIDDILSLDWDIYVSTRETTNDPWSVPVSLGYTVNSSRYVDGSACLSNDGLELYFSSNREGDGYFDIFVTTRESRYSDWGIPVNLGPTINTPGSNMTPWITTDGLELYFSSKRPGDSVNIDIYVSQRLSINDPWQMPVNLGTVVNSRVDDCFPCLSPDGLVLFFSDRDNPSVFRYAGHGQTDMWMTRRKSTSDPWGIPVNLGPNINSSYFESQPRISQDGSILYFTSSRLGKIERFTDIWQVSIEPVVDLNADGIIDVMDMSIMVDYLGTDEPLCDIGPMPWGDGIVDVEDLMVLAEYLFEEVPVTELVE